MGRSGSGKGTQIELLKEAYVKNQPDGDILYFYPGSVFREIVKSGSYTGTKIHEDTGRGMLVPDFVTNGLFVSEMVQNLSGDNQLCIFDGYPRTEEQAKVLDQMLNYYGREGAVILNIEVSEEEVRNRMASRGREDDQDDSVLNNRLKYYSEKILPVIDTYRTKNNYTVIDVNGVGDINDIHQDIMSKLGELTK